MGSLRVVRNSKKIRKKLTGSYGILREDCPVFIEPGFSNSQQASSMKTVWLWQPTFDAALMGFRLEVRVIVKYGHPVNNPLKAQNTDRDNRYR
jgi:hypothetical protein